MAILRYYSSSFSAAVVFALSVLISITKGYEIKALTDPVIMAESPFWDDTTNTVIFVDIIGGKVLRYDPAHPEELKSVQFAGRVSPAVPVQDSSSLLVGVGRSLVLADVNWGAPGENATLRSTKVLATVDQQLPGNRFNDGKADYMGRLWIGTMDDSKTRRRRSVSGPGVDRGSVYRFDLHSVLGSPFVTTKRILEHMQIPNGMVWTPTAESNGLRTFYLADSGTAAIYSYDFLSHPGLVADRKVAFDYNDNNNVTSVPDGMTIDVDGNLWVAAAHGNQVIQVDPRTGELLRVIPMPVKSVSAVEWGGPDRDVLYTTSSRYLMTEEELQASPDAGRMFAITGKKLMLCFSLLQTSSFEIQGHKLRRYPALQRHRHTEKTEKIKTFLN